MIDSTYEDKLYQTHKFAGAVRYNALKSCATRVCRACGDPPICVAERYPALRIGFGMGAHCAPLREKKSSAVPLFRSGHMSAICARLLQRERGEFTRGWKPQVSTLLCARAASAHSLPRGAARSRRPQTANPPLDFKRKTPRPLGANPPAAVRVPRSADAEKTAARTG